MSLLVHFRRLISVHASFIVSSTVPIGESEWVSVDDIRTGPAADHRLLLAFHNGIYRRVEAQHS